MHFDVIIIGAGAAGLFCAIEAGKRGRRVVVLEHAERVGKKIAISGGGRCNFTNINTSAENFISGNPNFCKSALARFSPYDFISIVEKYGIPWHEKKLGQLFCDGSSREIIELLLEECSQAGVEIQVTSQVESISRDDRFSLQTNRGILTAESLVIATGGLSIPKMGATDFGLRIARQFGLRIVEPRPGLVPLAYDDNPETARFKELSGLSLDSEVSSKRAQFRENTLLTHRGLSGPAILQVSSYWRPSEAISIDMLPGVDTLELLTSNQTTVELSSILSRYLPRRFAVAWTEVYAPKKPLREFSRRELETLAKTLHDWQLVFNRSEGFAKAEVTVGGVDTDELSSKTMETRGVPGLYFIGEVVDVTGWLGGYNFQWAWASAFAAGQYV
jgi:predicted Rossmann fold flavoprotein